MFQKVQVKAARLPKANFRSHLVSFPPQILLVQVNHRPELSSRGLFGPSYPAWPGLAWNPRESSSATLGLSVIIPKTKPPSKTWSLTCTRVWGGWPIPVVQGESPYERTLFLLVLSAGARPSPPRLLSSSVEWDHCRTLFGKRHAWLKGFAPSPARDKCPPCCDNDRGGDPGRSSQVRN